MTKLTSFADVGEVLKSKNFTQAGGGRRDSGPVYRQTLLSLSGDDGGKR